MRALQSAHERFHHRLVVRHQPVGVGASDDLLGVALGGAAKNVYAIASGMVDGLGLGESARAALLARSFAELVRLGEALGARAETLAGLSGLGDLVLTATSPSSRNFSFGREIGRGRALAELSAAGQPLAEGVATAPALVIRAGKEHIELPVAETVASVLDGATTPWSVATHGVVVPEEPGLSCRQASTKRRPRALPRKWA